MSGRAYMCSIGNMHVRVLNQACRTCDKRVGCPAAAWHKFSDRQGTTNCVTKIWPNVQVHFLVQFASKPLFYWVTTSKPPKCSEKCLALFVRFFGFVGPFLLLTSRDNSKIVMEIAAFEHVTSLARFVPPRKTKKLRALAWARGAS